MQVVYLGGKQIGADCLQDLLEAAPRLGIDLVGIGASARTGGIDAIARQAGLAVFSASDDIPECDLLLSVQYDRILKPHHIARARQLAVNLHLAPLPEYRGCNQFSLAILDQREEFGVTLHVIDEGIDSGDILFERRFPIAADAWVADLHRRATAEGRALFKESLSRLVAGQFTREPQQRRIDAGQPSTISYRKDIERLKQVDLDAGREEILRVLRATSMPGFDPPYALVDGRRIALSIADITAD